MLRLNAIAVLLVVGSVALAYAIERPVPMRLDTPVATI